MSSRPGECGGGQPRRGSGETESTRVPRRRPHLSRVCEYAAVVGLGQGRDICREAVRPSAVYGKSNRAAHSLCEHFFALVHSVVEEGEVLGVEFAGDKAGEVADLYRNFTECADDEARNAPRVL